MGTHYRSAEESAAVEIENSNKNVLSNGYILGYSLFVTGDSVDGGIDSFEISRLIQMISARFSAL